MINCERCQDSGYVCECDLMADEYPPSPPLACGPCPDCNQKTIRSEALKDIAPIDGYTDGDF